MRERQERDKLNRTRLRLRIVGLLVVAMGSAAMVLAGQIVWSPFYASNVVAGIGFTLAVTGIVYGLFLLFFAGSITREDRRE